MLKVDLRQAIDYALTHIDNIRNKLGKNLDNLLVEETELSEDEKFWLITIGFDREVDPTKERTYVNDPFNNPLGISKNRATDLSPKRKRVIIERVYKTFKVDASTGKVVSMKIYKL